MKIKIKNLLKNTLLIFVSLSISFLIVEIITREVHGYKIMSLVLWKPEVASPVVATASSADPDPIEKLPELNSLLATIPLASGVQKNWFYQGPPPLNNRAKIPNTDLAWRYKKIPLISLHIGDVYNLDYVLDDLCNDQRHYYNDGDELNAVNSIYVFRNKNHSPYPLFLFLKETTFPSGLVTNQFGFRGSEIPFVKPLHTIRIAFLGASTTIDQHNYPHSYPEYVGYWLNLWAKSQHLDVQFDVINAGASGYHSEDTAARFVENVLPLQPDIAIYYEGANQFFPSAFIKFKNKLLTHLSPPKMIVSVLPITNYSAFISDLIMAYNKIFFANAKEPIKPPYTIEWPASIDEKNPDLTSSDLPHGLQRSVNSFNLILKNAKQKNILFIPTSFVWNVYPKLILHFPHDMYAYSQLNTSFWPFSYTWLHRYAVFQNAVYREYAKQHHLYFIDIDRYYPRDNQLFVDTVHGTPTGVRMLAWVELQQLIPIIQQQIAAGKLPRTWQKEALPPNFDNNKNYYLITKQQVMSLCKH